MRIGFALFAVLSCFNIYACWVVLPLVVVLGYCMLLMCDYLLRWIRLIVVCTYDCSFCLLLIVRGLQFWVSVYVFVSLGVLDELFVVCWNFAVLLWGTLLDWFVIVLPLLCWVWCWLFGFGWFVAVRLWVGMLHLLVVHLLIVCTGLLDVLLLVCICIAWWKCCWLYLLVGIFVWI